VNLQFRLDDTAPHDLLELMLHLIQLLRQDKQPVITPNDLFWSMTGQALNHRAYVGKCSFIIERKERFVHILHQFAILLLTLEEGFRSPCRPDCLATIGSQYCPNLEILVGKGRAWHPG